MLFMLAGRDWARMVGEFEAIQHLPPYSTGHHEEGRIMQATFRKDILSFVKVVGKLGNPFVATSMELVALDTQNVMEESVVASLSEIREVGQTLHAAYARERLNDSSVPISDIIKRKNMLTFANRPESDLVNTSTTLMTQNNYLSGYLSLRGRYQCVMFAVLKYKCSRKSVLLFSFLARAVDQLDR